MNDREQISESTANAFHDLPSPHSFHTKTPARNVWCVFAAAGLLVFGGVVVIGGVSWGINAEVQWLARGSIMIGAGICATGFAVYDYRWPFGPKPSSRCET